jgi:hypothetical protein
MDDKDYLDCAVEMLRALKSGKTPRKVRAQLKKDGYTEKQIIEAGNALVKSF